MCWRCARGRTPLNVDPRVSNGPFRCVGIVQVAVRIWTWIDVLLPVCWPCARGRTLLDWDPRACTGPFGRCGPVHVAVRLMTWIHVPLPAPFGVLALCAWLYASRRGSTCLYRPFSVCCPCERGCTPLDVDPGACTGPIQCVGPVHVAVPVWARIHTGTFRRFFPVHVAVPLLK